MRFWISMIIVVGLVIILRLARIQKLVKIGLLIAYVAAVLTITLGSRRADTVTHIGFDPFIVYEWTIKSILQGWKVDGWAEALKHLRWQKGQLASLGLNVLLFVPLGYLVPSVSSFFRRWWKVVALGFLFSLLIESIQLVTRLGWFDASDLLHNTVGAMIGWIIYKKVLAGGGQHGEAEIKK